MCTVLCWFQVSLSWNSTTPSPTPTRTSSRGSSPTRPTRAIFWSYSYGKLNDTPTFSRRSSRECQRECRCRCRRRGIPALYCTSSCLSYNFDCLSGVDFKVAFSQRPTFGNVSLWILMKLSQHACVISHVIFKCNAATSCGRTSNVSAVDGQRWPQWERYLTEPNQLDWINSCTNKRKKNVWLSSTSAVRWSRT